MTIVFYLDAPTSLTYSRQHLLGNKIDHACTNFTFGSMEFYSPNYPENYPNNIECVRAIEGGCYCTFKPKANTKQMFNNKHDCFFWFG